MLRLPLLTIFGFLTLATEVLRIVFPIFKNIIKSKNQERNHDLKFVSVQGEAIPALNPLKKSNSLPCLALSRLKDRILSPLLGQESGLRQKGQTHKQQYEQQKLVQ